MYIWSVCEAFMKYIWSILNLETHKRLCSGKVGTDEGLAERAGKPTGFSVSDFLLSTFLFDFCVSRVIQTRSNLTPTWISSVNLNISKYKLLHNCQLKSATMNLSDIGSSFVCWNKNRAMYLFFLLHNDHHLPIQN